MKDIFVQCPRCGRAVSKKDRDQSILERYNLKKVDDFLTIPCIHCGKSSYDKEWKRVLDIPRPQLTEDLFKI